MFDLIPSDANDPKGLMPRYAPNKQTKVLPADKIVPDQTDPISARM